MDEAGNGVPDDLDLHNLTPAQDAQGYSNFACVVCNFSVMDYLYLAAKSHIRARFEWDKAGDVSASWVIP